MEPELGNRRARSRIERAVNGDGAVVVNRNCAELRGTALIMSRTRSSGSPGAGQRQKDAAISVVKSVTGVTGVISELVVSSCVNPERAASFEREHYHDTINCRHPRKRAYDGA